MKSVPRRRFLELGVAATATAITGCTGTDRASTYANWIPTREEGMLTAYIDLALSKKTSAIDPILPLFLPSERDEQRSALVPDLSKLDQIDDPLLRFPLQTGGRIIAVSSLSLAVVGLGFLLDPQRPTEGLTELLVTNGTTVATGEFDNESADEALRGGRQGAFGDVRFSVVREGDDFTFYEPQTDSSGFVALGNDAVVVAESAEPVRRVLDTKAGNADRATAENDTFEWLFETAGRGDIVVSWLAPVDLQGYYWGNERPEFPSQPIATQHDLASSVTFAPESDELTAAFALRQSGPSQSVVNGLEDEFGTESTETAVDVQEDRATVTGAYTDDAVAVDFVERTEMKTETPIPSGGDVPAEVAEAVPNDAFEFVYDDTNQRVRVNFRKEFEADEVTVRATQSGSASSSSTPGALTYLTVYVDSSGDEVQVVVTVDGESGVVARKEVP